MARFNPRRFGEPEALKRIDPEVLLEFLGRFKPYFTNRNVSLVSGSLDYDALAGCLVDPDEATPPDLVDALYLINEMSGEDGMQAILAANEELPARDRIDLGDSADVSPADVAMRAWLHDPHLLERKHAEQRVEERRSYEYFASKLIPTSTFEVPPRSTLTAIEHDLGAWFRSKKKGDVVRVFVFPKPDGVWFLVRHGEAFRREGALKGGESSSVFYRPEKYDVLVYNPVSGELRINASSKGEMEQYRLRLGHHLFADDDYFPASKKYTLEPLKIGRESISCADIDGIDAVRLREVAFYRGGAHHDIDIKRSDDVFASMEARGKTISEKTKIIGARFEIRFTNNKVPRSVYVRPPGVASFTRDEDGPVVDAWLEKRGFAPPRKTDADT